jgi:hypothetical protein
MGNYTSSALVYLFKLCLLADTRFLYANVWFFRAVDIPHKVPSTTCTTPRHTRSGERRFEQHIHRRTTVGGDRSFANRPARPGVHYLALRYNHCTRELSKYLWHRQQMCACVTPLFLSEEHWSLVKRSQRYFSHVFVAFRYSAIHSIGIHLLVLLLLIIFEKVPGL